MRCLATAVQLTQSQRERSTPPRRPRPASRQRSCSGGQSASPGAGPQTDWFRVRRPCSVAGYPRNDFGHRIACIDGNKFAQDQFETDARWRAPLASAGVADPQRSRWPQKARAMEGPMTRAGRGLTHQPAPDASDNIRAGTQLFKTAYVPPAGAVTELRRPTIRTADVDHLKIGRCPGRPRR